MSKGVILIADDDPGLLAMLGDRIVELGYTALLAENGAQAFAMAKEQQPHLIITDIQMPDMDGIELNTLLHLEQLTKDIPVIMLTGNDVLKMQIGVNFASTMKFECILPKTAPLEQITEKIREVMERYYQL